MSWLVRYKVERVAGESRKRGRETDLVEVGYVSSVVLRVVKFLSLKPRARSQ